MFGIGFPELVVIFIVALLVLGPERLPEVAKSLARWVNEFRRAADELKKELGAEELEESRSELQRVHQELLKKVYMPPPPPEPEEVKSGKRLSEKTTSDPSTAPSGSPSPTEGGSEEHPSSETQNGPAGKA